MTRVRGRFSTARRVLRRLALVAACAAALIVPVWAAVEADDLESLGFDEVQLQQALFGSLRGWYDAPDVPEAARALSAEDRVTVVKTMGAFAKSYFASPGFKKEYVEAYKRSKPKGLGLPSLDVKSLAKSAAEKATGGGQAADPSKLDKDPAVQLAKRLEAFLAATDDVDFEATTHDQGSRRMFDKAEYEAKPAEWKMCYRAGKETTEAVRAFARDWLAELK
jgi:hypothetical protein